MFYFFFWNRTATDQSRPHSFYTLGLRLSRSKVTDLLSIALIETRKGRRQGETNTTRSSHKFPTRWRNLIPKNKSWDESSSSLLKYHQQINAGCSLKNQNKKKVLKQTRKEFYKLTLFLLFNLLRRLHLFKPMKPEKFDPIPRASTTRHHLDQISRTPILSWRVDRQGLRRCAGEKTNANNFIEALDVLIATLFKRLYNFPSFLTWSATIALVAGPGVETI